MQNSNTAYARRARVSVLVERKPFTPFNVKSVKSRLRLIDTSSDKWHIGEDSPISIDFSFMATADSQFSQMIVHQLKAFVSRELPHKSPTTVFNAMNFIRAFFRSFEFEDLDEESFDEVISDNLLYYIQANRSKGDESNLSVLRYWYHRSYLMGLQGFNQETAQALSILRFRGNLKGADVLSAIPNRGPLTALELKALREALREFEPSTNTLPGLIFVWLLITLGIRSSQAALLMRNDFAVHVDENSGYRNYILNVPSVKKRYSLPRTFFKQRSIPTFLGEMIERYLNATDSHVGLGLKNADAPMFSLREDRIRRSRIVCEQYEHSLGRLGMSNLNQALLGAVNNQRRACKKMPLTFKITPRRLRKTFATNAAAMGVPMVELAELLDHEDLQHVMVYYKLGLEFATKLDKVMEEQYQDILTYFRGEISLKALVDKSLPTAIFGPDRLRKLVGIGMCAKGAPCNLPPQMHATYARNLKHATIQIFIVKSWRACNPTSNSSLVMTLLLDYSMPLIFLLASNLLNSWRKIMTNANTLRKSDALFAELKNLWQPSDSKVVQFNKLVDYCKKQIKSVFPTVDWDDDIWEISFYEPTQSARQATHNSNVLFTKKTGAGKKVKVAKSDQTPLPQPLLDLAKSFVVLRHLSQPVNHSSHMVSIRAFRYLCEVFEHHGLKSIHQLSGIHFDEAAAGALRHNETDQTLYRTGEHLSAIAERLNFLSLSTAFEWHNPFRRVPGTGGTTQISISKTSDIEQAEQLPKTAYLVHLAALWRHYDELAQNDQMTVCMGVLLMITGLRMDEFCGLHDSCIPTQASYESQPPELTFSGRIGKTLRLKVLARKRFAWDEKVIPSSMIETVFLVFKRMTTLSEEARQYCHSLLVENRWPALNGLQDDAIVSVSELKNYLGYYHDTSSLTSLLERYGVLRDPSSLQRPIMFKVLDIHKGIASAYREQIGVLADGLGPDKHKIPIWQLLTLQFKFALKKHRLKMFPIPLSGTQVQDAFRGRNYVSRVSKQDSRICSLFERYSFDGLELPPGGVRTHQFRHLLNTIMQQTSTFSQEDIAKYFLRAGVRDNVAYDHSTPSAAIIPTMDAVHQFGRKFEPGYQSNRHDVTVEDAVKFIRKFPLLSADELLSELDSLGSSHLMDIGRCQHDYTQEPCGNHYACLNNCQHYRRVKGNSVEIARIQKMIERAEQQIAAAELDVEDGLVNSHVWLAHHRRLLAGCNAALAIEHDLRYQTGQVVAVFPNGRDSCEAK